MGSRFVRASAAALSLLPAAVFGAPRRPTSPAKLQSPGNTSQALINAVQGLKPERALALINAGADPNAQDRNGQTALMHACMWGEIAVVRLLIQKGADVNATDREGQSAMSIAGRYDHPECILALLQGHASWNKPDRFGATPLLWVVLCSGIQPLEFVLNAGLSPNARDQDGTTLLMLLLGPSDPPVDPPAEPDFLKPKPPDAESVQRMKEAERAHFQLVTAKAKLLLEHHADPNPADVNGLTAWHRARRALTPPGEKPLIDLLRAYGGQEPPPSIMGAMYLRDLDELQRALKSGANPNPKDPAATCPLLTALAFRDCSPWVRALLAAGASPDVKDRFGTSALWKAMELEAERGEVVNLLLKAHADPEQKGPLGDTPLMSAVFGGDKKTAQVLLENGAKTEAKDEDGRTALMRAKDQALVDLLLDHGAAINAADRSGATPLLVAIHDTTFAEPEVARRLMERGADVNACDKEGETPLYAAISSRRAGLVPFLLARGADVNARTAAGETPLMAAASENDVASVRALLGKHADVNAKSKTGMTALKAAKLIQSTAIVALLKTAGATR